MKQLLLLISFTLITTFIQAQILEPVKWTFDTEKVDDKTIAVTFTATVDEGWYVYAQDIADGGPIPTEFTFETLKGCKTSGKVEEVGKVIKKYDSMFDMDLKYYKKQVQFKQLITHEGKGGVVEGYLTFMTCNGEKCLPPTDVDFKFEL